ncbi:MAG: SDR family oxidoreductase [Deltaproteobacteria bacterium]|nr:SDR family oxidoreductase [Deltaproteobacteria bacterium]
MKTIVITGSTRGIGLGLAREFLKRGCNVMLSGRNKDTLDSALEALGSEFGSGCMFGTTCDVAVYESVQALWDAAAAKFGAIDIWINNAGVNTASVPLWELPARDISAVVSTNLTGTLFGCKVALQCMLRQGSGQIYLFEGHGSDDRKVEGLALYGATKRAVRYLCESLQLDVQGKPVQIGAISPGIVLTDLILNQLKAAPKEKREKNIKIFNILADTVETVTPWLAEQVLANTRPAARIAWLTPSKVMGRFLTAGFKKRNLFKDMSFE